MRNMPICQCLAFAYGNRPVTDVVPMLPGSTLLVTCSVLVTDPVFVSRTNCSV